MRFYVDVDNTLCTTSGCDYENAIPIQSIIDLVNNLHKAGHHITIYTARGSLNKDRVDEYFALTKQQLEDWGVEYDHLSVGEKPVFDFIIDDRAICLDNLRSFCEHIFSGSEPI